MGDIDRARLSRIRNGQQGLALTIYLDVPPEAVDAFMENDFWQVAIFSPEASTLILEQLNRIPDYEAIIANDAAGHAISLLLEAGEDRQAWLRTLIETVARMRTDLGDKPDPLSGCAQDDDANKRELRQMFEEQGYVYRDGDLVKERSAMRVDDVISAAEALLNPKNGDR